MEDEPVDWRDAKPDRQLSLWSRAQWGGEENISWKRGKRNIPAKLQDSVVGKSERRR